MNKNLIIDFLLEKKKEFEENLINLRKEIENPSYLESTEKGKSFYIGQIKAFALNAEENIDFINDILSMIR